MGKLNVEPASGFWFYSIRCNPPVAPELINIKVLWTCFTNNFFAIYVRISLTTFPCTSVSRKRLPWNLKVSRS